MQDLNDKLQHHELTAEWIDDRSGPAVMLTQSTDGYDEPNSVLVHPWQLRAVCEKFGLVASDPTARKTIAMLTRRLLALRDRVDHLDYWLSNHSDSKHADLSYEQTYARATADIAAEFCAELVDAEPQDATPAPAPIAKHPTKATAKPAPPQASLI